MGALIIRCTDGVIDVSDHWARLSDEVRMREIDGTRIPLVPLEWQLLANTMLGRENRAKDIARHLLRTGYDGELVASLMADERNGARTIAGVREALQIDE